LIDLEKLDFTGLSEKSESPFSVWKYVKRIVKIEIVVQKGARENLEYNFSKVKNTHTHMCMSVFLILY